MPNETIILDPSEVATSTRSELNINSGAIEVRQEGIDWGTAAIEAAMAQQTPGESVVDYRVPNREITIPLVMRTSGTVTFNSARDQLGTKVAQIQAAGGWLKRVTAQGGTYFADIVSASVLIPGGWLQRARDVETEAVLTLTARPDFYGAEETLSDHTETSAAEITFTETTTNGGDFPLGDRVRVVIDEDDADSQRGLFWSFRARHYASASTAQSALEAESLSILDTATRVAKTGASGGTVVTHGTLMTNWTPVLDTGISYGGTVFLTHTGTNRIYGRVFSTSGTLVQTRLIWDVGDMVYPVENAAQRLYDGGTFHIIDYGEVRLDRVPTGTHRWEGIIQARGDVGGEAFSIDRLWIVNQDESAGFISLPPEALSGEPSTFLGRDSFNQSAGNLNAAAAAVGGAWDTSEASFDGVDFTTTGGTAFLAQRAEPSDAANAGRPALLGSAVTGCGVQVDAKFSAVASGLRQGVLARYTDAGNYMLVAVTSATAADGSTVVASKRVSSTNTELGKTSGSVYWGLANIWYTLRLTVDAAGNWAVTAWIAGNPAGVVLSGQDGALAAGGALASGRVGFYDEYTISSPTITRNYDNFVTWAPAANAVMYASQSMELATTGITREDSAGAVWVAVPGPYGDLPRMPNRSSAGTVEFMAKASRGDMRTLSDPGIDDISARIYRRPSYLTPD